MAWKPYRPKLRKPGLKAPRPKAPRMPRKNRPPRQPRTRRPLPKRARIALAEGGGKALKYTAGGAALVAGAYALNEASHGVSEVFHGPPPPTLDDRMGTDEYWRTYIMGPDGGVTYIAPPGPDGTTPAPVEVEEGQSEASQAWDSFLEKALNPVTIIAGAIAIILIIYWLRKGGGKGK